MSEYTDITKRMNDAQLKQYLEYQERYCENHQCDKCKNYLLKFKERVLDAQNNNSFSSNY